MARGNESAGCSPITSYVTTAMPGGMIASWDAFNGHLEEQCRHRQGNVLRGHREIGERFVRDREALKRPLPAPFDACDKQGRTRCPGMIPWPTLVACPRVGCGAGIRPLRSWSSISIPAFAHKIGALDQAAPLAGWECHPTLRRLLEARIAGKRPGPSACGDLRSRGASF